MDRRDHLEHERNLLSNGYGYGQVSDGLVRDRIVEIDALLACYGPTPGWDGNETQWSGELMPRSR